MFRDKAVLITGASSGIGAELARRFARDGSRLILVARREDRLQALAKEITPVPPDTSEPGRPRPGPRIEIIPADLLEPQACDRVVAQALAAVGQVDVLVNNAGIGEYGRFAEKDLTAQERMIQLNVSALVRLTHQLVPQMIERRSGWVLNIASSAGFQPTPYMAIYGATKAFVLNFSMSLWEEVRRSGVAVTCVCPGPVKTEFFDRGGYETRKEEILQMAVPVERVADGAYRALTRRKPLCIPSRINALSAFLQRFVPRKTVTKLAAKVLGPR